MYVGSADNHFVIPDNAKQYVLVPVEFIRPDNIISRNGDLGVVVGQVPYVGKHVQLSENWREITVLLGKW